MKKRVYINPNVEVVNVDVEWGYGGSYGESGEPGDNFDIEDNGDF